VVSDLTDEVVSGLGVEEVSGLLAVELNPKAGPDCSWYIV